MNNGSRTCCMIILKVLFELYAMHSSFNGLARVLQLAYNASKLLTYSCRAASDPLSRS